MNGPMRKLGSRGLGGLALALILSLGSPASAWTPTHRVKTPRGQVLLRALSDEQPAILFAYLPPGASVTEVLESPMWEPQAAARHRGRDGELVELTVGQTLSVGDASLHIFLDPVTREPALEVRQPVTGGSTSSYRLDFSHQAKNGTGTLRLRAPQTDHLYGLGEQFPPELLGQADGDLLGQVRYPGASVDAEESEPKGVYGNSMVALAGGSVSNALFPVLHLIDDGGPDALLFLDNPASSRWDFRGTPWKVELRHGLLSGALAWGRESGELRRQYMEWIGRPPVPPRKAFGLWVSEYGYENWDELEEKAQGLLTSGFPLDGFVLDLQWFGGILEGSHDSRMGSLTFDTSAFPNPAAKISELAGRGLGLIVIEEAYIAGALPEYSDLADKGFLVSSPSSPGQPLEIDESPWWGLGSMLDYTNPEAAAYWHRLKREPLRAMGILGHWTDLGEPEMFRHVLKNAKGKVAYETPRYHNDQEQIAVNNLFALRWAESIYEGFGGAQAEQRPFILGRTGTSGIQRFGASLWSGDIGANWESLRSHYRAQSHLAMSGLDYFGSDVGGFYRRAFTPAPGGYDELYTRWFAAACLTDIPLRPHTMNLGNAFETAPHLVGHAPSNLANLRQRYRLIPYLYSAAHRAYSEGTPLVAPPVAYTQGQQELDLSGVHKWIGADLFARLVLEPEQTVVSVTLPAGRWYDFESGEPVSDKGGETLQASALQGDLRRTPLYARGGAIIPLGSADSSEPRPERLELVVFPGDKAWEGALVEDDGWSQNYRKGGLARTSLRQSAWMGRYGSVTVGPRQGALAASLGEQRDLLVKVASSQKSMQAVVDGVEHEMTRHGGFWVLELPGRPAQAPTLVRFR
jgi:alpha-glucosidase (family GH31 glycosyl hydrolase)